MSVQTFADGGYRFIPAVFQYSGGVAAEPGMRIERAAFSRIVPMAQGFERIEKYLTAIGRPTSAFCAASCVRQNPFTEQGFRDFNAQYGEVLTPLGRDP